MVDTTRWGVEHLTEDGDGGNPLDSRDPLDADGSGYLFNNPSGDVDSKNNYIIFMIGGITPAEIRDLELLAHRRGVRILIGGTQILTPKRFMNKFLRDPETEAAEEIENRPKKIKPHKTGNDDKKKSKMGMPKMKW